MMNMKRILALCMAALLCIGLVTSLSGCTEQAKDSATAVVAEYKGIDTMSPEWVGKLDAAKDADQLFIVAAFSQDATDAWISLHEKQSDGTWHMVMTTPGVIGKSGIGKTKEGDGKSPQGVFRFNCAFGIEPHRVQRRRVAVVFGHGSEHCIRACLAGLCGRRIVKIDRHVILPSVI